MRICDRWMQEGRKDRRGQSNPSQCTTSHEDRQIVRMAVTDRSVTSRTIAQHIESVTHPPVSARIIRRRLQQSGLSARRPPLTQNHRRQWCDERRIGVAEWNEVVFTDESVCNSTMVGRPPPGLHFRLYQRKTVKSYIDVLRHNLLDSAEKLSMENTFIFQQDNDPKHNTIVTKPWLLYHVPRRLETPPHSPDLNPIENLWMHLDTEKFGKKT
ncbi:transposable element Tc1 transposase [Trichonephila clavipes]|nr:transposable element Tc1 transposase [Trichonephila clavipes]